MALLRARFRRPRGGRDRVIAVRSDDTEVGWGFPTYGGTLPHDLIHLAVEAGFGLRRGLWGRVDGGADPARINEDAARRREARFRGFGDDRRELLMAEALAAVHWFDTAVDDAALCDAIAESCARLGVSPPPTTNPERVAAVRAALATLRARWRALGPAGTLELTFDVAEPEASLGEVLS